MEEQPEYGHNLADTIRLLSRVADGSASGSVESQRDIIMDALYWLKELRRKLESIKTIEYETGLCTSDGTPVPTTRIRKYMFYNTAVISDDDAAVILDKGLQDFDSRVVDLWPQQAAALFPNLLQKNAAQTPKTFEATPGSLPDRTTCPSCGAHIEDGAYPGPYDGEEDNYGWIVSQFDCPHCGDHLGAYYDEDNDGCFDRIQAI